MSEREKCGDGASATVDEEGLGAAGGGSSGERLRMIPLHLIFVRETQTRSKANERVRIEELKGLIEREGFNSAILVMRAEGRFEVVAGHRRYHAAKETGLPAIPCIVTDPVDEQKRLVRQITENTHRNDLDPVEKANAYVLLMEASPGKDQKAVAKLIDVHPSRFSELLKIARLPTVVKEELTDKRLSEAHAILIASTYAMYRTKLPKEESTIKRALDIVGRISRDGWSLKALRNFVSKEKERLGSSRKSKATGGVSGSTSAPIAVIAAKTHGAVADTMKDVDALFTSTDERLVVDRTYLKAGFATAEDKAALAKELDAIFDILRKTPTRMATAQETA